MKLIRKEDELPYGEKYNLKIITLYITSLFYRA